MLKFSCKHLVLGFSYTPLEYFETNAKAKQISKCVLITDKSIMTLTEGQNDNVKRIFVKYVRYLYLFVLAVKFSRISMFILKNLQALFLLLYRLF